MRKEVPKQLKKLRALRAHIARLDKINAKIERAYKKNPRPMFLAAYAENRERRLLLLARTIPLIPPPIPPAVTRELAALVLEVVRDPDEIFNPKPKEKS